MFSALLPTPDINPRLILRSRSFNVRVGASEKSLWNSQPLSFRCYEIDNQFKPCGLHHWKISGLGTLEDLSRVHTGLMVRVSDAWAVADKTTVLYEFTPLVNGGQPKASGKRNYLCAVIIEQRVCGDH